MTTEAEFEAMLPEPPVLPRRLLSPVGPSIRTRTVDTQRYGVRAKVALEQIEPGLTELVAQLRSELARNDVTAVSEIVVTLECSVLPAELGVSRLPEGMTRVVVPERESERERW